MVGSVLVVAHLWRFVLMLVVVARLWRFVLMVVVARLWRFVLMVVVGLAVVVGTVAVAKYSPTHSADH